MSDAGAPPEAIALAIEEIEAMQSLLDCRRAADRDRKRAQREAQKSAVVLGHSEDSPETVRDTSAPRVSLDKKAPHTPQKIKPIPCVHETRARGWHRLPEGWAPTRPLPAQVQSKVDLWPPGALDDELAAMRRWAANAEDRNGKGRKLDWEQAWRNWIGRRHDERYSRKQDGVGKSAAAFAALNLSDDQPF
jgi:hypothetical protein